MGPHRLLALLAALLAALLDRGDLLRRATGAHHCDVTFLDDLARIRVPVVIALDTSARVALHVKRMRIALLPGGTRAVLALFPRALTPRAAPELLVVAGHVVVIAAPTASQTSFDAAENP